MNSSRQRKAGKWHWLFLAAVFLMTLLMDVYMAERFLDGDASQPLVSGWVMAQHRNPFTTDLYLTTEFPVFDASYLAYIFFLFINDWSLVRILTTLALQAWYVLGFLYLCKQSGVAKPQAFVAAGMLLLPLSIPYARVILYHMYYLPDVATVFWMIGLTVRLTHKPPRQKQPGTWLALVMLWVLAGMEGIRYMMLIGVPMLAWLAFDILHTLQGYQWSGFRLTDPVPLRKTQFFPLLHILAISFISFLIGYALNSCYLIRFFEVGNSSTSWYWPEVSAQHYTNIFHGWLKASGIRVSFEQLVGVRGLAIAACLLFSSYVLVSSYRALPGKSDSQDEIGKRFVRGMFICSLATTTLIFMFDSLYRHYELYYVPVVALAFPVLAQEMAMLKARSASAARKLLLLLTCACVLFQGAYSYYFIAFDKQKLDSWTGLSYTETTTVDQVRDCIAYMQDHGYTHGLINYWYANPMVELSDGSLFVGPLGTEHLADGILKLDHWGTFKSAFEPENMPQKVIVFIKREECASFEAGFPDAPLLMEGWIFNGYELDSSLIE